MKSNSNLTIERLRETINKKSGCDNLYLKVLKSELFKLLSKYMNLELIDFSLNNNENGYKLSIDISVNEFFEIGN